MINTKRLALKEKLKKREKVFACWTSLSNPSITEIFCRTGVDFVGIDIEHSTINQEQSQRIIAACQANDTLCLPRIATHNMEMIKQLLDSGADGIIAPMVNSAEEARQLVSWCKYPPHGVRSFGISRAQGYGFDFEEYAKSWNDSFSLIVQIESAEAVMNIEEIIAVDGVDAVMIGPYDLSGSLNVPGQLDHPSVVQSCRKVLDICMKKNKSCGTQVIEPTMESMNKAFDSGYSFTVLSSDIFLLWKWSERTGQLIKEIKK